MRALLKSYGLSDNELKLYIESVGKFPLTFNEIRSLMDKLSEEEIKQILDNLIEKIVRTKDFSSEGEMNEILLSK